MFRLLGPLVLATGDDEVAPATQKLRRMLAVLPLDCNKPVSLDRLAQELWGDRRRGRHGGGGERRGQGSQALIQV